MWLHVLGHPVCIFLGHHLDLYLYTCFVYLYFFILLWELNVLLSRVSILTRDINIPTVSVPLSVCLSVSVRHVSVFYENGLTYCHNFFTTQ